MATITCIENIVSKLVKDFINVCLNIENIGLLVKFNLIAEDLSSGDLFNFLDSNGHDLGIS